MLETIEEKCQKNGVKLTDQRRIIARVISESKKTYGFLYLFCIPGFFIIVSNVVKNALFCELVFFNTFIKNK